MSRALGHALRRARRQASLLAPVLLAPVLLSTPARAQDVVVRDAGAGRGADIVRRVLAGPHVVRTGSDPLVLPRDSTITTSLLVLGRPTYLASRVQGDVVVVGADLFLRPGVDVSGRAVAIGGTVAQTSLGRVTGGVESLRDETYAVTRDGGRYALDYRSLRVEDKEPLVQLAGIKGVKIPAYDRVDGLSLPVGVVLQFGNHALELEPSVTYRSRLGVVDGALVARTRESAPFRAVGRIARDTRTNERWIRGDLVNSAASLFVGSDARNYFRADLAEARVIRTVERAAFTVEPFLGGRFERVRPITAVGNVWSVFGRRDTLKMARPNPSVERGNIGSALAGAEFRTAGVIKSRALVDVEQSVTVPAGTSRFTQVTVGASVDVPTFKTQTLKMKAHGVGTTGSTAPRARYAYLGGSGTLNTLELLEQGGTTLLYVESRYLIPVDLVQLPFVGSPVVTLRDAFGAAGVGSLPALQHEVGIGVGLSVFRVEYTRAVAGKSGHEFGIGISLSSF
ncbi:MAG TPA: hypothetical protein VM033_06105 [Gemmatimonadaceae bacterium]|nr:hypothetical protein [Gemmatimonadaceae bacterium]